MRRMTNKGSYTRQMGPRRRLATVLLAVGIGLGIAVVGVTLVLRPWEGAVDDPPVGPSRGAIPNNLCAFIGKGLMSDLVPAITHLEPRTIDRRTRDCDADGDSADPNRPTSAIVSLHRYPVDTPSPRERARSLFEGSCTDAREHVESEDSARSLEVGRKVGDGVCGYVIEDEAFLDEGRSQVHISVLDGPDLVSVLYSITPLDRMDVPEKQGLDFARKLVRKLHG